MMGNLLVSYGFGVEKVNPIKTRITKVMSSFLSYGLSYYNFALVVWLHFLHMNFLGVETLFASFIVFIYLLSRKIRNLSLPLQRTHLS